MTSLLVTNDFPPKVGGIQSYLWELWRRLPAAETTVLTTSYSGDRVRGTRSRPSGWSGGARRCCGPRRGSRATSTRWPARSAPTSIFVDPALPLGRIVASRSAPRRWWWCSTVPRSRCRAGCRAGRCSPGCCGLRRASSRPVAIRSPRPSTRPAPRSRRSWSRRASIPSASVPPDDRAEYEAARAVTSDCPSTVASCSARAGSCPRKGFDVLIDACALLPPDVTLVIVGDGRDRGRLERHARSTGHRGPRAVPRPLSRSRTCRSRTVPPTSSRCCAATAGAASRPRASASSSSRPARPGLACVAGRSGGSHEAVLEGRTGFVVEPRDVDGVASRLRRLLDDPERARPARDDGATSTPRRSGATTVGSSRWPRLAAGDLSVLR